MGTHRERHPANDHAAYIATMSTSNLVVELQKLARNISCKQAYHRQCLLEEAARRLQEYRNQERTTT